MNNSEPLPAPMRQAQLIRQLAQAVARDIDPGWDRLRYVARKTCEVSMFETYIYTGDIVTRALSADEADDLSAELRSLMYQPGVGTWFTFTVDITPDGQATSSFDYDNEPDIPIADPAVYITDQEKFPRDREHQPAWYRERLAEGERLIAERTAARQARENNGPEDV